MNYLNEKMGEHQCGDEPPSSSFSLEFSSENNMEGSGLKDRLRHMIRRTPSPTQNSVNFVAISDPEGYDIETVCPINEINKNNKLYICGDIIDSTGIINQHDRLTAKSNNLKNIQFCLSNTNVHLIFGNHKVTSQIGDNH